MFIKTIEAIFGFMFVLSLLQFLQLGYRLFLKVKYTNKEMLMEMDNSSTNRIIYLILMVLIYGYLCSILSDSLLSGMRISFMIFFSILTVVLTDLFKIQLLNIGVLTMNRVIPWKHIERVEVAPHSILGYEFSDICRVRLFMKTYRLMKTVNVYVKKSDIETFRSISESYICKHET